MSADASRYKCIQPEFGQGHGQSRDLATVRIKKVL